MTRVTTVDIDTTVDMIQYFKPVKLFYVVLSSITLFEVLLARKRKKSE
jgi:hypothetical protein